VHAAGEDKRGAARRALVERPPRLLALRRAPAVGRIAAALGALEELQDVGPVVRPGLEDLTHGRDRRQRAQLGEAVRHVGAGQAVGETLQARQLVVPPVDQLADGRTGGQRVDGVVAEHEPREGPLPAIEGAEGEPGHGTGPSV
jgi:hypothetical protein